MQLSVLTKSPAMAVALVLIERQRHLIQITMILFFSRGQDLPRVLETE